MADINPDRYDLNGMSKDERHQMYLEEHMAGKIIDDDLEFDVFDIESLVAVGIHVLSGQYEYFARFFNGVIIGISAYEFRQACFAALGHIPVAHASGLLFDGYSAQMWVLDRDLQKCLQDGKRIGWQTPVHKIWKRLDAMKVEVTV
jgi:hypothetical protein